MSDSPPAPAAADPSGAIANLSLDDRGDEVKEEIIPDMDDIPDMEDEGAGLEEEDDAAVRIVHPSA
jgi:ubiquitin-like-conjugating enzyme ATG3